MNLVERFDKDFNIRESCEALDNIDAWLEERELGKLDELSTHVRSGGKVMQCHVYGGAFNFMKVDEFISVVASQTWKRPDSVRLLIKDEQEDAFTIREIK
jgi:hypothetical protein